MERRAFLIGTAALAALSAAGTPALAAHRKRYIMPDLMRLEHDEIIRDNTRTMRYKAMTRWTVDDGSLSIESASVDSDTYRQWLSEDGPFDHPPHIAFGGAVESIPGGDPEFHNRWLDFARTLT